MPTFNVHVYPIFRTTIMGVVADNPADAASIAENAVMKALAFPALNVLAREFQLEYADGLDTSVVDTDVKGDVVESVNVGPVCDQAARIANSLKHFVAEGRDVPAEFLTPVLRFLEVVGR